MHYWRKMFCVPVITCYWCFQHKLRNKNKEYWNHLSQTQNFIKLLVILRNFDLFYLISGSTDLWNKSNHHVIIFILFFWVGVWKFYFFCKMLFTVFVISNISAGLFQFSLMFFFSGWNRQKIWCTREFIKKKLLRVNAE